MINLIGCTKDNFFKILKLLNYYSVDKKEKNDFFVYRPKKITKKNKKFIYKKTDTPFKILSSLDLK